MPGCRDGEAERRAEEAIVCPGGRVSRSILQEQRPTHCLRDPKNYCDLVHPEFVVDLAEIVHQSGAQATLTVPRDDKNRSRQRSPKES